MFLIFPIQNFFCRIAKYILDDQPTGILREIALQGIEENLDTPTLRILAEKGDFESPSIMDGYFLELLNEMKLEYLIEKRKSATIIIKLMVSMIIDNKLDSLLFFS